MKTEQLNYHLPAGLIAQRPAENRSDSKLLVFNRCGGEIIDSRFCRVGDFLTAGDCLVLNDTKVLPARFFAGRSSGARIEGLFLAENAPSVWNVMLKGAGKLKVGERICLKDKRKENFCQAILLDKTKAGGCMLKIETEGGPDVILDKIGFPPLPPYIKRNDDPVLAEADRLRYQTVYARRIGAVAAPTAGLHFTDELIGQLKTKKVQFAYVTLHIGAGTFKPVTAENLEEHQIHQEWFSLNEDNAEIINRTKQKGGRIIAVGTTSVRTLETIADDSRVKAAGGTTKLFITPGYKFKIVDAMITNFHLPKSTLLALVAAFAGLENILAAYRHAIEQRYRFYSYGDAMLII